MGGSIIGAEEKRGIIVTGNPEHVIAGGGREEISAHALAVIVVHVRRRFKKVRDHLNRGGIIRESGVVGQIGHRGAADAAINFAQNSVGLRDRPVRFAEAEYA